MIRQFNLAAEVVRPGTAQKLERGLPAGKSTVDVILSTVVSRGWIKSDRNHEGFLRSCGEFVIVDEAHTCAARKGGGRQQRCALLRGLAADPQRHLVLLTATPHSGDQEAFENLLGLLDPKFEGLTEMPAGQRRKELRDELGNYFVRGSSPASGSISCRSASVSSGPICSAAIESHRVWSSSSRSERGRVSGSFTTGHAGRTGGLAPIICSGGMGASRPRAGAHPPQPSAGPRAASRIGPGALLRRACLPPADPGQVALDAETIQRLHCTLRALPRPLLESLTRAFRKQISTRRAAVEALAPERIPC